MKQRMLKFTPEELIRTLQGKSSQLVSLIDMELVDIKYDAFIKQVTAIVRSDTFEDVPEGMSIPEFMCEPAPLKPQIPTPISTTVITDASPKPPVNTQKIVTPQKLLIQTSTTSTLPVSSATSIGTGVKTLGAKPETNIDTCGFEDEFTKEQRKLLKFTSTDDYVIVKPTHFLKTEWEDINDTVKSIGGKWVKGAIDHWVIPKTPKQEE
jgi:hypothetical protein